MRKPQPQPATPSQSGLWPDVNTPPETPLAIIDDTSGARYSLAGTMECGGEFVFALLLPYAQRTDAMAARRVVEMKRLRLG
jgi:hypothetical protein